MAQKPDAVNARDNGGGGFDPHPEGQFAMTCVDVIYLGWKLEQYPGSPEKEVEKAALVFASGERHDGGLHIVTAEMTVSMGEKANMRRVLQSWRGKSYTPEQVAQGVPLDKLHGQHALVNVEHITTKAGRKFAKIGSIGPLPKVMQPPPGVMDEYTRPAYFATRKEEYAKGIAAHREKVGALQHAPLDEPPPQLDDTDDDLPF